MLNELGQDHCIKLRVCPITLKLQNNKIDSLSDLVDRIHDEQQLVGCVVMFKTAPPTTRL